MPLPLAATEEHIEGDAFGLQVVVVGANNGGKLRARRVEKTVLRCLAVEGGAA